MVKDGKKKTLIRVAASAGILIAGFAVMQILSSTKIESKKREPLESARRVATELPHFGNTHLQINANGTVRTTNSLDIQAAVSGKIVYAYNNLKSGTLVEANQIIIGIDSRQAENNLHLARANLINSLAAMIPQLSSAQNGEVYNKWNDYLSLLNIEDQETAPLPEIADVREKLTVSKNGIFSSYYQVKNAEIALAQYVFTAPFDGYISGNGVTVLSMAAAGQRLATIVDAVNLEVSVPVTIGELENIDINSEPEVSVFPSGHRDISLKGQLARTDTEIDPNSQLVSIHIEFKNADLDPNFFPGKYVDISVRGRKLENVAVLSRDIIVDNTYVYVYRDGRLAREKVDILALQENRAIIDDTLPADTEIITTILQKPLIGMKLEKMDSQEATKAQMNK